MRGEKLFKRSEVRKRLNVSRYGYEQLIDEGILAKPIRLSDNPNAHPRHTESQLLSAEKKLYEKANPRPKQRRQNRGLSEKQMKELREIFSDK